MRFKWLDGLIAGLMILGLILPALAAGQFALPNNGQPSIVKLGADWCPPCRQMKPVIKELTAELKGKVNVIDVDIDKERGLARQYKVNLIPTTLFFDRKGKNVGKVVGFRDKQQLREQLKKLGLL
jgi:thioredoxin 1